MKTLVPAGLGLPGRWAVVLMVAFLAGCASAPGADPRDPWEPYNRSMTKFNDAVDDAVLKPAATVYKEVLPRPVRSGVGNFFGNLGDAWSFVNNVLQAKPEGALHSFWRVVINTSIGLGGLFDPATEMRLERHRKDFGQTLGWWGVPSGPYVVLPILGPSTLRDTAALPVDSYGRPQRYMFNNGVRNSFAVVQAVDVRARLLEVGNILDAAALDPYTFRRDAYLQKRRNDIYDGNPPQNEERYDLDEGGDAGAAVAPGAPASSKP
ncbi:MlaA family lipoprotein [Ottowia caeni]|uniref:MlaA family lipoprotein n=1 Tax=Ottowia caeni TaxID=2870339 RepID=UPI001E320372|nr:VacJ family lipoprotein [Ottowia caeni]